jgi:hypothetical protein
LVAPVSTVPPGAVVRLVAGGETAVSVAMGLTAWTGVGAADGLDFSTVLATARGGGGEGMGASAGAVGWLRRAVGTS